MRTAATLWVTTSESGDAQAPAFGRANEVFNVIDARQAYLQRVVVAGLRALGFNAEADRSTHFSYEIVALTPRCAAEMGYTLSEEDSKRPYVEVSGRKGHGVKADDLLDRLEAAARAEVDERHPSASEAERAQIAHAIAIGALRYFSAAVHAHGDHRIRFQGRAELRGRDRPVLPVRARPHSQYFSQAARAGARRRSRVAVRLADEAAARLLAAPQGNDLWELALLASSLGAQVEAAVKAQEPAFIAKYAFQLAQAFNLFYHKHHILSEEDAATKTFLLQLAALVERQLMVALDLLGIEAPERM